MIHGGQIYHLNHQLEPVPACDHIVGYEIENETDPILAEIYNHLLIKDFLDCDDLDHLDSLRYYLASNPQNETKQIRYHVLAAMRGSDLLGATLFAFFGLGQFCMMKAEYTAVKRSLRNRGIGRLLLRARDDIAQTDAHDFGYRGVDFSVITVKTTEPGGSLVSESIWRRLGYRRICFPFVQLPLAKDKAAVSKLDLGYKGYRPPFQDALFLSSAVVTSIVRCCNYFRHDLQPADQYLQHCEMLQILRLCHRVDLK